MDFRSASGLFLGQGQLSVRRLVWLSVALLFAALFVAAAASNESNALPSSWFGYLWVLPLSVVVVTVSLLVANLVLGSIVPIGVPSRVLSGAYLVNGPSIALLSVSTSLGMATPAWVSCVTPAILLTSAWAYYRSLGPVEEEGPSISKTQQWTQDEVWVMGIERGPTPASNH